MNAGVRLAVPITKFEDRPDGTMVVMGRATSEDFDRQGEVVDYEGTKRASQEWEGNVREQHNPHLAVGRRLEMYWADEEKALYVKTMLSSGAKDTQAKVREGVLRYYSVGGDVKEGGRQMVKVDQSVAAEYKLPSDTLGKTISILRDWSMNELSLVDVGANPTSEVSIVKMVNGKAAFGKAEDMPQTEVIPPEGGVPEPANPAEDEMVMREHLVAARAHLEAAARMELDEVDEHGTYCLEQVVSMMSTLQMLEQTKLLNAAVEVGEMATKSVTKGSVKYELDKAEMGNIEAMIGKMGEMVEAMKAFMSEHGTKEAAMDTEEKEAADAAAEEETPSEEATADATATEDEEEKEACKVDQTGPMPTTPKKEASVKSSKGAIAKGAQGPSSIEKKLDAIAARLAVIESLPLTGGPVRFAPVNKSIAHGLTPERAAVADDQINKAFQEVEASGQPVSQEALRWALAKQAMPKQ